MIPNLLDVDVNCLFDEMGETLILRSHIYEVLGENFVPDHELLGEGLVVGCRGSYPQAELERKKDAENSSDDKSEGNHSPRTSFGDLHCCL